MARTKYRKGKFDKRVLIQKNPITDVDGFGGNNETWIPFYKVDDAAESGTTTTNIEMEAHGMETGDYIINTTRSNALREVTKVDDDNVTVSAVTDQADTDVIEKYITSKSKVWMQIEPYQGIGMSSMKDEIDGHKRAELSHTCKTRYRSDILSEYRIKYGSRYLYIENIFNDGEQNQWLKLMTQEKPN